MAKHKIELVVNPTSRIDPLFFNRVIQSKPFMSHYEPTVFSHPSIDKTVIFTHPYFKYTKPIRASKKNGQMKPPTDYIVVYDPEFLGQGMFGAAYVVSGVFKIDSDQTQLKERSKDKPRWVVKTNAHMEPDPDTPDELPDVSNSYKREYSIGQYVPHMGYRMAPVFNKGIGYLLMDEQPGVNVRVIIEQLKINRNYLSFTDQLRVIIELLEQSDEQISNIIAPANERGGASPIVHRDIKPENILLDLDTLRVKFIDYGLAKKVNIRDSVIGTALYKDPLLYKGIHNTTNHITDFSSLSRVIAEFLGDTSYDAVRTAAELLQKNEYNLLPGLLNGISDISPEEHDIVFKTVQSITGEYHRLTKANTIDIFKKLLTARLEKEDEELLCLAQEYNVADLMNLNKNKLLQLLKSKHALLFLQRLNKSPEYFTMLINILGENILSLDVTLLLELKNQGMDFSPIYSVNKSNLQAKHLKTLIELSVPLNESLFAFWVETANEVDQELNWIEVFRILYDLTGQDEQLLSRFKTVSAFKILFFSHCLKDPQFSRDDKSNARLIKRHIELVRIQNELSESIKTILSQFFDGSALQKAILSSDLMNVSQEPLQLVDTNGDLEILNSSLKSLVACNKAVTELESLPDLSFRDSALQKMKEQITMIVSLQNGDWLDSITKVEFLEKAYACFLTVENHRKDLLSATPPLLLENVNRGINSYYQSIPLPKDFLTGVYKITIVVDKTVHSFQTVKKTKEILEELKLLGFNFPSGTPAERRIIELEKLDLLSHADEYQREINQYHKTLSDFCSLMTRLKEVVSINECFNRESISKKIITEISQALIQAEPNLTKTLGRHLNCYIIAIERVARKLNSSSVFQDLIYELILNAEPEKDITYYEHITLLIDIIFSSVWINDQFLKDFNRFFTLISSSTKKDFCDDKMKSFKDTLFMYLSENPQNADKWNYIHALTKIMKEVEAEHSPYNSYRVFKEVEIESCVVTPPMKTMVHDNMK